MARLRTLPTFLLLATALLTAVPVQASMRCEMQSRAAEVGKQPARPCRHCKQSAKSAARSFSAAVVKATCCELRAATPTPPADVQQRGAREVTGSQALATPPSSPPLLAVSPRLPAPPASRQQALGPPLALYRPLLR